MVNEELIKRIQVNHSRGEEIVKFIENELPALQKAVMQKQQEKLASEIKFKNWQLKKELDFWMKRVSELEVLSGLSQYPAPSQVCSAPQPGLDAPSISSAAVVNSNDTANPEPAKETARKAAASGSETASPSLKETKKEKSGKSAKQDKPPAEENKEVNVSRLDLRIGRILNAKRHPDAESLYVEEIDVGEDKPRTVVSGLVKFVPLEEMQNRLVVVLCNLKPAKMRGITSEAMVMCASTPEKVEILIPPPNSLPGDRVTCESFPGEPDVLLNPKKKIFEQVAPDLKTDGNCAATYKSAVLTVVNKGVVKSASLTNVQIK